jgi:hypothetical protein
MVCRASSAGVLARPGGYRCRRHIAADTTENFETLAANVEVPPVPTKLRHLLELHGRETKLLAQSSNVCASHDRRCVAPTGPFVVKNGSEVVVIQNALESRHG